VHGIADGLEVGVGEENAGRGFHVRGEHHRRLLFQDPGNHLQF
jgi:hypothetical protein